MSWLPGAYSQFWLISVSISRGDSRVNITTQIRQQSVSQKDVMKKEAQEKSESTMVVWSRRIEDKKGRSTEIVEERSPLIQSPRPASGFFHFGLLKI